MARNLEFIRDRGSVAWNIAFPVLVIIGMSWVFSGPPQPLLKWRGGEGPRKNSDRISCDAHVQWVAYEKADEAILKLRRHKLDFLWQPPDHYWVNDTSPNGAVVERSLRLR